MNINITDDATFYNSVCNNKRVLERVSWTGDVVDIQPVLDADCGFILEAPSYGGFFFNRNGPGSYVIHTAFLPSTPVGFPYTFAKECLWALFMALDVECLYSSSCDTNPAAARLMRKCGFKKVFSLASRFDRDKLETFYRMDIDDYILMSDRCLELGGDFHKLVEETTNHDDDEVHDRYAGAAVAMIKCGNFQKAELVYNRWAVLSGYEPLYVNEDEKTVEVGFMKILMTENMSEIVEVICQEQQQQ